VELKAKVKQVVEKVRGKGKQVKLDTEPTGTKARSLDNKLRAALEEITGVDLKRVRVHTGGNAAELAKGLKADAFAKGSDIYFAKPGDAKKPELIAHEVAHVIQQAGGRVPAGPKKGKASLSK
jgi:hypothetical protein